MNSEKIPTNRRYILMPLKRCQINGQEGWKWGDQGTCYPGSSGKDKALKQAYAEIYSMKKAGKTKEAAREEKKL
jgi:hypothetical protein